jgi:hypothetical protein
MAQTNILSEGQKRQQAELAYRNTPEYKKLQEIKDKEMPININILKYVAGRLGKEGMGEFFKVSNQTNRQGPRYEDVGGFQTLNSVKKRIDYDTNYLFNNIPPTWPKDMYPGYVELLNKKRELYSLPPFIVPKVKVAESGNKKPGFSRTFIIMSILGLILLLISIYLLFFRRSKNTAFGRRSRFGRRR